jgi:hypothetical protein
MNLLAGAWQLLHSSNFEMSQPSIAVPWYLAPQEGHPKISSETGDLQIQHITIGSVLFCCSTSFVGSG